MVLWDFGQLCWLNANLLTPLKLLLFGQAGYPTVAAWVKLALKFCHSHSAIF